MSNQTFMTQQPLSNNRLQPPVKTSEFIKHIEMSLNYLRKLPQQIITKALDNLRIAEQRYQEYFVNRSILNNLSIIKIEVIYCQIRCLVKQTSRLDKSAKYRAHKFRENFSHSNMLSGEQSFKQKYENKKNSTFQKKINQFDNLKQSKVIENIVQNFNRTQLYQQKNDQKLNEDLLKRQNIYRRALQQQLQSRKLSHKNEIMNKKKIKLRQAANKENQSKDQQITDFELKMLKAKYLNSKAKQMHEKYKMNEKMQIQNALKRQQQRTNEDQYKKRKFQIKTQQKMRTSRKTCEPINLLQTQASAKFHNLKCKKSLKFETSQQKETSKLSLIKIEKSQQYQLKKKVDVANASQNEIVRNSFHQNKTEGKYGIKDQKFNLVNVQKQKYQQERVNIQQNIRIAIEKELKIKRVNQRKKMIMDQKVKKAQFISSRSALSQSKSRSQNFSGVMQKSMKQNNSIFINTFISGKNEQKLEQYQLKLRIVQNQNVKRKQQNLRERVRIVQQLQRTQSQRRNKHLYQQWVKRQRYFEQEQQQMQIRRQEGTLIKYMDSKPKGTDRRERQIRRKQQLNQQRRQLNQKVDQLRYLSDQELQSHYNLMFA